MKLLRIIPLLYLFIAIQAWAFPAKFSVSPDNSQDLIFETINSAQKSIVLNVYMITSFKLEQAIIQKINKGVTAKILIEAEPYGKKIVPPEKKVLDELSEAFKNSKNSENQLLVMTSKNNTVKRRYVFNHAKYIVIDEKLAYISSENFVGSGTMAYPDKKGNRGWQVLLNDAKTAKTLLNLFTQDTNLQNSDVAPYDASLVSVIDLPPPSRGDNTRNIAPFPAGQGNVSSASICASPKSIECIKSFIKSAKKSLDIQHLDLPLYWIDGGKKILNPSIDEAIKVARKGVKVRILINPTEQKEGALPDDSYYPSNSKETVAYINKLANEEKLELQAAEMNNEAIQTYLVHNKGMLVDGNKAWVSSINGTQNSVRNNREVAVSLSSKDAAEYFGTVFDFDWNKSIK